MTEEGEMWTTYMRRPDDTMPHIQLKEDDVAKYALLPGPPERARRAAEMLDDVEEKGFHREYQAFTGSYKGVGVTVMSTGMGVFSAVVGVEELAQIGTEVFIRIGSTGAIQEKARIGDLVIPRAAVRDEGASIEYMPENMPAMTDLDVLDSLREAAQDLNVRHHVGVMRTREVFYERERSKNLDMRYAELGVLSDDMELSGMLSVAADLDKKAGGIMTVGANLATNENRYKGDKEDDYNEGEKSMFKTTLEAVKKLEEG